MTSISSVFGAATMFAPGTAIRSVDKTAFSSAITDIVNGLKSGATAATTTATGTAASATTSVKDRVDGLIDKEVSDGKLSTDQATELKSLLAKAAGHMHHIHAPKSSTDLAATDDTTTDALGVSATTATAGGTSLVDEATQALGGLISGVKSAAATGLYGAGGIAQSGLGSLLIHAFV
jgi:polyhydroxyalkanoate synthesis regulator phasin